MNGNLKSVQFYSKGKDDKSWIFYFSNGNKRTEAVFDLGKRIGQWNYYAKNGALWKINFYDDKGLPSGNWYTYDTINGGIISIKNSKEILN